ncbi:hypothetical protein E3N88_36862 [Mikania micrantha]|uniref:Reverse transcriptase domain-containing protein n=1 Tax=Mikania micrantha TaxID=192012 RepID=A0A5N6M5E6_9ASTR|nr:hypothetical protein E3N88_36862 [Mikania micrantha]
MDLLMQPKVEGWKDPSSIHWKEGLVLSKTKMKIAVKKIDFLGATIGDRKIKLQSHIIKKIADFRDEDLMTLKGLRSWLGILNYARSYIPNLGRIVGPLYAKTGPNRDKRMKKEHWDLIRKINEEIERLPEMEIPPT